MYLYVLSWNYNVYKTFSIVFILMKLHVLICWCKKSNNTMDKSSEKIYLFAMFQTQIFITCNDDVCNIVQHIYSNDVI